MEDSKEINYHGIVMNQLITLRDALKRVEDTKILALAVEQTIRLVQEELTNK